MRRSTRGTVSVARKFLGGLDLDRFRTCQEGRFLLELNLQTEALQAKLPGHEWGFARKGLNIFLRSCLYNLHLRERHHLDWSQLFLEIPLDRLVATEIRKRDPKLPRWKTIRDLDADTSGLYQSAALRISHEENCPRVYLDSVWYGWRGPFDPDHPALVSSTM